MADARTRESFHEEEKVNGHCQFKLKFKFK